LEGLELKRCEKEKGKTGGREVSFEYPNSSLLEKGIMGPTGRKNRRRIRIGLKRRRSHNSRDGGGEDWKPTWELAVLRSIARKPRSRHFLSEKGKKNLQG